MPLAFFPPRILAPNGYLLAHIPVYGCVISRANYIMYTRQTRKKGGRNNFETKRTKSCAHECSFFARFYFLGKRNRFFLNGIEKFFRSISKQCTLYTARVCFEFEIKKFHRFSTRALYIVSNQREFYIFSCCCSLLDLLAFNKLLGLESASFE